MNLVEIIIEKDLILMSKITLPFPFHFIFLNMCLEIPSSHKILVEFRLQSIRHDFVLCKFHYLDIL